MDLFLFHFTTYTIYFLQQAYGLFLLKNKIVEELFPQTNELLSREFKLKKKLFTKRDKTHHFIKVNGTHCVS